MIGKVLGNRYEILERIGEGGMALVYKARCQLLDRFVAIKILKDEYVNDEEFVRKFRRESQAAASLSHPNIVNIYDVGVENDGDNKIHYIVMEYIKGKTLKDVIIQNGKLSLDDTINYSNQIGDALQDAHKNNIVHRDIKPQNIMITDNNRVKVTDFGIARAATTSTVTTTSDVLGSVHYFSPEQARGGYTDEKSDIYSLGIVMYEMITGTLPYKGESPITVALKHVQEQIIPPRELDSSIPKDLEIIILRAVEKRQSDRYTNIGELLENLKKIKKNPAGNNLSSFDNTDSYTKIIPAVNVEDDYDMKNKKKKKQTKKDGSGKVIFLGIFLAFLLATGFFLGSFKLKDFFTSSGSEIIMPKIVGFQEKDARKKVEDLGLEFKVESRVKSSEFKAGEVVNQSVEEGTKLKKNYPIEVIISEGQESVKVPNVVNEDILYAEKLLDDVGLFIGSTDYEYSDTVPVDQIIRQTPERGSEVEPSSKVNLVISQGEEIKKVKMPKVVGLKLKDAESKITEKGLVVGDVKEQESEEYAKGIVTWSSYEPGTELETKTAVDLYVSSGPSKDVDPDNNDNSNNDKEGPITFTLSPRPEQDETQIKIIRTQDGIGKTVYDKKLSASKGEETVTLQGKAGARFDIFYDDDSQPGDTIIKPE